MTIDIKQKANSFGKLLLVALCSGSISFALGSIRSVGEYKEKVDSLEKWRTEHSEVASTRIAELEEVKRKQEVMISELKSANKKLDRLEQKFDQRWFHTQ